MVTLLFIFIAPTIVVWLILFVQTHHLFYAFRDRYSEEARQKIKYAFEFRRHPSKFFYFLSSASAKFLEEKNDKEMLSKRRMIVRFLIVALAMTLGSLAVMGVFIALLR